MKPVIIIALAFVLLIPVSVFAQESLISVQTDDNHYDEGDTIVISGRVTTVVSDSKVILQIIHETTYIHLSQIEVAQDGSFTETVIAEGPLWKKAGEYIVRASYQDQIAETEFSFNPKSELIETTTNFEVDAGSYGTFDVEFSIKGGTVRNMVIDSDIFAIIVQIDSTDEGTITLDLPREYIGAEKQDGTDDTFIILIDGIEVAYQESVVHLESRTITINFEEGDSDITIIGTYGLKTPKPSSYPSDSEFLDNPGPGVSTESIFRIIPEKPNVGSSIRVTGDKFGASLHFDFHIDSIKVGSFATDNNGHFITTMKIPENQKADRVDFIIKDSHGNEKSISLRIGEVQSRITESPQIPFTVEIAISPRVEPTPEPTPKPEPKELGIASFVDKSKDPQSYIDRYNSEPSYKKWFHDNYPQYDSIEQAVGLELTEKIPNWVKNIFGWYAQDQVSEDELLDAIKYLIDEGILVVN